MRSHFSHACFLLPVALQLMLVPNPGSTATSRRCGSIYRGFAQCLLALGDSMSQSVQRGENTQEIDTVCRSWDEFHTCANVALAGCPDEAAAVWESLRQESKKMQFSGNLYDMCANRVQPSSSVRSPPSRQETNQESLKGDAHKLGTTHLLLLSAGLCLWLQQHRI
ncbi:neuritin 1-like a [Scleropages formosus]|uniref:Neuritin 1 like n=1 Tax=Scleropages formosus TaxID=113540 RepID=A0A8C9RZ71_SCLFO|nr:neuritin-like protein [Scleropages formosus]